MTAAAGEPIVPIRSLIPSFLIVVPATLGLLGTQVLWIGSWNILSGEKRSYDYNDMTQAWSLLPNTAAVRFSYLIVGISLVVLVDSLYRNAGMITPVNPSDGLIPAVVRGWNRPLADPKMHALRLALRATLAFVGMMLLWVRMYL